ncbi:uncharacterized protein LOC144512673 isoform X4 [Sander vitreus]
MRLNYCLTILHVSILAALFLTLDADSEVSNCKVEIKVGSTVYEALLGEDLRINCTVAFCNNSQPTVSWYKVGETKRVPVKGCSHIKTECKLVKHLEGISFLVFEKIRTSDSGVYQCKVGCSMSLEISVSVHESPEDTFWPYVYRGVGLMVFVLIMLTLCVATRCWCKGESRHTPDLSCQPSHDALPPTHIYEND